ncbi:sulfatase-like hydrolase/transferase [Ruegeria sp. HKCCA5426]|uniref:sulfatase-like hydrolase/transferase n=1 Tax=Ruegeria sp. HKCCA5426 TaxID=2682985 RepID=UPI0035304055
MAGSSRCSRFSAKPTQCPEKSPEVAGDAVVNSTGSTLPNIYHIVFDAYSGRTFPAMSEVVDLREYLNDFTYFPKAMAHYPFTDLSVPSYLTGKTYRSGSVIELQTEAKIGGLSEMLRQAGCKTSSYSPNRTRFWSHSNASQVYATSDEFQEQVGKTFMLVSAVRATPEPLRQEVHAMMSRYLWNGENAYSHYKRLSVPLVEKFLQDEPDRAPNGHYNYVHLILPHGPYVRSGDCSIQEETSYFEQAECATRLMARIVEKLKEMERYNSSIIVFQSDHGEISDAKAGNPIEELPLAVQAEYDQLGHNLTSVEFLGY